MAFWNRKKPTTQGTVTETSRKDTIQEETIRKEKIRQAQKDLESVLSDVSKSTGVNLLKIRARVVVLFDHSGSMDDKYRNGTVQHILDMFLPFGLQFDDDGNVEVYIFDDFCKKLREPMTKENYTDYVRKNIRNNYGGTRYSVAVEKIDKDYNDAESKTLPTIVFFITDGECFSDDKHLSDKAFIQSADHGIFWALIGVSSRCNFDYLRHLDDLNGRSCDNTGFMKYDSFEHITSLSMFTNALKDFVPWLKAKGYVR